MSPLLGKLPLPAAGPFVLDAERCAKIRAAWPPTREQRSR
jgi:hypothetical protein